MIAADDSIAAVDLGSNSFHIVVARVVGRQPVIVDRLREQVQLASGLDEEGNLAPDARERALDCLARFGQRIRSIPPWNVRAVGTNTLRVARGSQSFLDEAEEALGRPIEIISGREEARLIYLGVSHTRAKDQGPRLVVDIGGGSTECIVGERFEARVACSVELGCISHSRRHFPDGAITRDQMREAVLSAELELRTVERTFRGSGWEAAVGASGTIRAAAEVLRLNRWAKKGVTAGGLGKLMDALVDAGHVDNLSLDGLKRERAPVFPGGVAVLAAVFSRLGIERMDTSKGALREGVLYDLLGRLHQEDVRERTIVRFQERYHVDREQAQRVEQSALDLLSCVESDWSLDSVEPRNFLAWAARLHECGLAISYDRHHVHGAYLVANSGMPGFSREDHAILTVLVRGHRNKPRKSLFKDLPRRRRNLARRLTVLLRLAVRLNRGRSDKPLAPVSVRGKGKRLFVTLPPDWPEVHPLTCRDLEAEVDRARELGIELKLSAATSHRVAE